MKKFNQLAKKKTEHLYFSVHHHFSCQNLPIDGVKKLAEEYTTTKMATFFTILTNKTLPNLPSQGGFAPLDPPL